MFAREEFILYLVLFELILSLVLIVPLNYFAWNLGLLDKPNNRKIHTRPIPKIGGILIWLVWLIATLLLDALSFSDILFLSSFFILGLIDDFIEISGKIKLIFIFLAFTLKFNFLYGIIAALTIPPLIISDGVDALFTTYCLGIIMAIYVLGISNVGLIILIVPLLVFLIYNLHPAKNFLGENGALFLSALILFYILQSGKLKLLFLISLPLIDLIIVMLKRLFTKKNIFAADKTHLHHLLYNKGGNILVIIAYQISILIFFLALKFNLNWLLVLGLFYILYIESENRL